MRDSRQAVRFALLAFTLFQAACAHEVTGPSDLEGAAWRLQAIEVDGANAFVPEDRSRFTIEFGADEALGVRADCNLCGGSYALSSGRMTVGPLACTLIACPTNRGQEFASLLQGTTSIELEDAELRIGSDRGTLVLMR